MNRTHNEALLCFNGMCKAKNIAPKAQLAKAKLLLGSYRRVCWAQNIQMRIMTSEGQYMYTEPDMKDMVDYLNAFDPKDGKECVIEMLVTLADPVWMKNLFALAMERIKEFPVYGELYHKIIKYCYMEKSGRTESQMVDLLGVVRSTYYDRKKEAVMVFAAAFWGCCLPHYKELSTLPADVPLSEPASFGGKTPAA